MNPKKMDPGEILVRIRELRQVAGKSDDADSEYDALRKIKRDTIADLDRQLEVAHRRRRSATDTRVGAMNEIGMLRTELWNRAQKSEDAAREARGMAATKRDHAAKSTALATTYRSDGQAKATQADTERGQGDRGNRADAMAVDAAGLLAKADEAGKRASEASAEADRLDKVALEHEHAAAEVRAAMAQVDSVMGG